MSLLRNHPVEKVHESDSIGYKPAESGTMEESKYTKHFKVKYDSLIDSSPIRT